MTRDAHWWDSDGQCPSEVDYKTFIKMKSQLGGQYGFKPIWMPDFLYGFQSALTEWALQKGRGAIFADCGLGKSPMALVWAENVRRKTNKPVLLLTPLAVGPQFEKEGGKFGIECKLSRDGTVSPNITITNYEQLSKFNSSDFSGVICDESSILKHFTGATQKAVTRFMSKIPYRLLCTATAAPNDYTELGTSSEALGGLGYSEMITRFFVLNDKSRHRMNDVKMARGANTGNHYARLAYRVSQQIGQWRMKGHAQEPFWKWVASWARACRMPSDLGFDDGDFILPELDERHHIIKPNSTPDGMLFTLPAFGLAAERDERRRTLKERCEYVANLVDHNEKAVVWCHLNTEGDLLEQLIPNSVQVKGSMSDDQKIDAYNAFANGDARVIVIKPKIGAWGLNWQFCNHVVTFVSHSYEQYYQSIRRCWRFGQKKPVQVDIIATEGETYVRDNMVRKSKAAEKMFDELVRYMNDAIYLKQKERNREMEIPTWL